MTAPNARDHIVYKSSVTGREFRRSADPALVELAKQADAAAKVAADERRAQRARDLHRAVIEGPIEDRIDLLKLIDTSTDAARRERLLALFKGRDSGAKS